MKRRPCIKVIHHTSNQDNQDHQGGPPYSTILKQKIKVCTISIPLNYSCKYVFTTHVNMRGYRKHFFDELDVQFKPLGILLRREVRYNLT
jgi:hypothetical protein